MTRLRTRRVTALLAALLVAFAAPACSSDDGGDQPAAESQAPQEVVEEAARSLETTTGVHLELSTPGLPDGVTGISGADGIATDAPAFEGKISVILAGTTFDVPVVSVDDTVYAQLPLDPRWQDIDPTEYNAPDPAGLISGEHGFATLLPATTDVEKGKSVRGGVGNKEVLTTYTGSVPGPEMKAVIPSSAGDAFDATYQITDSGELREASFTGVFYAKSPEMTYTVTFDDYGTTKDIKAP